MKTRYPLANVNAQWFAGEYPGRTFTDIEKVCLHTTECPSWPGYRGGKDAPNLTVYPNVKTQSLFWRAHFPINMSSRALENRPGGVETNTDKVVQVEMIGTCDPAQSRKMFYWPAAPFWALQGIADFLRWMHDEWDVPLTAPERWLPYPSSYGRSSVRMSGDAWSNFRGVVGHQHVPENVHGDPGALDINAILRMADTQTTNLATGEEEVMDDNTITKIAQRSATETWNRFLVPDDGVPKVDFRTALGEILDNTQTLVGVMEKLAETVQKQQEQIGQLLNLLAPEPPEH